MMTANKAVYSWDIEIKKWKEFLFIEKRAEENMMNFQTVSETAQPDF